jgi:hypothetical protein
MRFSTKARISSASTPASSLTPFSKTVWLIIAMPASIRLAQAARAGGVNSRG